MDTVFLNCLYLIHIYLNAQLQCSVPAGRYPHLRLSRSSPCASPGVPAPPHPACMHQWGRKAPRMWWVWWNAHGQFRTCPAAPCWGRTWWSCRPVYSQETQRGGPFMPGQRYEAEVTGITWLGGAWAIITRATWYHITIAWRMQNNHQGRTILQRNCMVHVQYSPKLQMTGVNISLFASFSVLYGHLLTPIVS